MTLDDFVFGKPKKKKRSLTTGKKYAIKADAGNKCQYCHKSKDPRLLKVHHLDEVSKAKTEGMTIKQFNLFYEDKPKKPAYDRKSNLMVLCGECHDKYHHGMITKADLKRKKSGKKKKATKRKPRKKQDDILGLGNFKIF